MAFRYETNPRTQEQELVIDGWENGIADSPYQGLSSIRNLNIRYLPGAVYSNYKRIINSPTAGSATFTVNTGTDVLTTSLSPFNVGDSFMVSTTGSLPAPLAVNTIYYKANISNQISASYSSAGGAGAVIDITTTGTGVQTITMVAPGRATYWTQNPISNIYYIQDVAGRVWESANSGANYWTLLTGNEAHLGTGNGIVVYKGYLFSFHGTVIDYCGDGSSGGVIAANWSFSWKTGLTGSSHMAIWGQDDIMYFCNGNSVASVAQVGATTFNPGGSSGTDYNYNSAALRLPSYEQNATWLAELRVDLLIAAGKKIYPWDRTSTSFNIPMFIKETINRMINIMNIIYVSAGVKGNLYIANGYSISPFKKIPDSFFTNQTTGATVVDPQLSWGDMMGHRNKLYVGCADAIGNPAPGGIAGIFSVDVDAKTLNFENQSSSGLTSTGGANAAPNVLIDLDDSSIDQYISAWYDGTNAGMDKNNMTLYSSFEQAIESDLIATGTFFRQKTWANIEFKFDQPMQTTDSIRLSWRPSLSSAYTVIGTITGKNVFSWDITPANIVNTQWLQLKVEMSSGATSQYLRLREIRVRSSSNG